MKNRLSFGGVFLAMCLAVAGCGTLELRTGEDGKQYTALTDALNTSSGIISTVSGYVPEYGVVGGGVALLLSSVANGILSIAVRRRKKKSGG